MHRVAVVGGGRGGAAVLATLAEIKSVQVVGVSDVRSDVPAFQMARKLGIETTTDTEGLVKRPDLQVIFEVTGQPEVLQSVNAAKAPHTQVVGAEAAAILMEIVTSRRNMMESMEKEAGELSRLVQSVSQASDRIGHSLNELAQSSHQLAASGQTLSVAAEQTEASLSEVEEVLGFIRQIANKTRMIGLNAAIEAARVGEAGKGFAVVASEVRKLAQTSNESSENISKSLAQTLSSVKQILQGVVTSHDFSEKQAAATTEVSGALQQLTAMVKQLSGIAEHLANSK